MKKTIQALTDNGWEDYTIYRLRKENVCRSIAVTTHGKDEFGLGPSTLYTCFRPARPKGMTPVAYYRKYKCVPEKFTDRVNGRYYCNPAHCSRSWTDKNKRDEHLSYAYGALG